MKYLLLLFISSLVFATSQVGDIPNGLTINGGSLSNVISGTTINSTLGIHGESTDVSGLVIRKHSSVSDVSAPNYVNLRSRNTSLSPTAVISGDVLSLYRSAGFDGDDYVTAAQIQMGVDATPGANDMPGNIRFYTTQDGGFTPIEAVKIDSNQNLNIFSQKELRLMDASGGEYLGLRAPNPLSGSVTWTLPDGNGSSNQFLKTNGAGVLSWSDFTVSGSISVASINVSGLTASRLVTTDGSKNLASSTVTSAIAETMITTGGQLAGVRHFSGRLNCDSSSVIGFDPENWLASITNISAGACTVTIETGRFSTVITSCLLTSDNSNPPGELLSANVNSTTSVTIDCSPDGVGDCAGYNVYFNCQGY